MVFVNTYSILSRISSANFLAAGISDIASSVLEITQAKANKIL